MAKNLTGNDNHKRSITQYFGGIAAAVKGLFLGTIGLAAIGAIGQGIAALIAGIGSAAAAAVPLINSLAAALVSAAQAFLIVPGAIAVLIGAFATLKLGLGGVGEAMKSLSADTATFNAAIKDLAPSAQEFVKALRGMREQFGELKKEIQDTLFEGWGDAITELVDLHFPALEKGLVGIAEAWNMIGRRLFRSLSSDQMVADLPLILENTRDVLFDLSRAINPLVSILRDLAMVGSSVFAGMTDSVDVFFRRWADRVSELRQSGELRDMMLEGIDTLKMFGAALMDIGGIIKGVFGAAGQSGGGLFGLLDRLNEFVNESGTQKKLMSFFSEMGRIGDALLPVLSALLGALGVVAKAIGDIAVAAAPFLEVLVTDLGDALAALAPGFIALGPAVEALGGSLMPVAQILSDLVVGIAPGVTVFLSALAEGLEYLVPAAQPLGEALGAVLEALAPLLPMLGGVLANAFINIATLLVGLAEVAAPLIEVFSALATEWSTQLTPVLLELGERLLPVFAEAGVRVMEAFEPLIPVITELITQLVGTLPQYLPILVEAFEAFIGLFAGRELALFEVFVDVFRQLAPLLPPLIEAGRELTMVFLELFIELAPVLGILMQLGVVLIRLVSPAMVLLLTGFFTGLTAIFRGLSVAIQLVHGWFVGLAEWFGRIDWGGILGAIGGAFTTAWDAVYAFFAGMVEWVQKLPGIVWEFLSGLPEMVTGLFQRLAEDGMYWIGYGLGTIVRLFLELPGQVGEFVSELYHTVKDWMIDTAAEIRRRIRDGIDAAVQFFRDLPPRAEAAVSRLWSRIRGAFTSAVDNVKNRARALVDGFVREVNELPDRARSVMNKVKDRVVGAFRNARTWLYQAGKQLVEGLARGIADAVGAAVDAAVSAGGSILQGFRDAMGISSPSKRARDEVGVWIPAGVAEGIRKGTPAVEMAMQELVRRANQFPGNRRWDSGMTVNGLVDNATVGARAGSDRPNIQIETVVLDASQIRSVADLAKMLEGVHSTARQFGARPGRMSG